jgi:hypothetical protein
MRVDGVSLVAELTNGSDFEMRAMHPQQSFQVTHLDAKPVEFTR